MVLKQRVQVSAPGVYGEMKGEGLSLSSVPVGRGFLFLLSHQSLT